MPDNKQSFETGSLAITAAGTAEQFTAHRVPQGHSVKVIAHASNTGYIYIGETKAKAEAHHVELKSGATLELYVDNASDIWADSSVNSEKVGWAFEILNVDA